MYYTIKVRSCCKFQQKFEKVSQILARVVEESCDKLASKIDKHLCIFYSMFFISFQDLIASTLYDSKTIFFYFSIYCGRYLYIVPNNSGQSSALFTDFIMRLKHSLQFAASLSLFIPSSANKKQLLCAKSFRVSLSVLHIIIHSWKVTKIYTIILLF